MLLRVEHVTKSFGGVDALCDVSFSARRGQIVAIIGPNGAGKTTLLNIISGVLSPDQGSVWLGTRRLDGLPSHKIASAGVARTFQNLQLFGNMTVLENVAMGRYRHGGVGLLRAVLGLANVRERDAYSAAMQHLRRTGLTDKAHWMVPRLPLGEQRMVELLRALAAEPRLLLLDEPTAGLNAIETVRLAATISRLPVNDVTVLLVEHDMNLVMSIADWVVVLDYGQNLSQGRPEEIQHDPAVIEAYLGREDGPGMPLNGGMAA
jgi:ABC-type branched-subunit amino acid transport system ATPase component